MDQTRSEYGSRWPSRILHAAMDHPFRAVFLMALLVRLFFIIQIGDDLLRPLRDQRLYLRLGESIATGKGLQLESRLRGIEDPDTSRVIRSMMTEAEAPENRWKQDVLSHWVPADDPGMGVALPGKPTAIIEPLYPVFLGMATRLWNADLFMTRLVQTLLAAGTSVTVAGLAGMIGGPAASLYAGMGFALYPHLVYYTGIIATETLYITLQLVAFLLWAWWLQQPSPGRGMLAGIMFGGAFLTRSAMLPIGLILLAGAPAYRRRTMRTIHVVALGFLVVATPWIVRNGKMLGEYRLMPTKGGLNLWMQNHPGIQQQQLKRIGMPIPDKTLSTLRCRDLEQFPVFADSIPEVERDRILTRRAIEYISCNPRYFARLCWIRLRWYLKPTGSSVGGGILDWASAMSFTVLLALGLVGLWFGRRHPVIVMSGLIYGSYLLTHTLFHGGIRYRIPADAVLLIPAGFAISHLVSRLAPRRD